MGKFLKLELAGQSFGRLTAVTPTTKRSARGTVIWLCQCSCGQTVETDSEALRAGYKLSCGCAHPARIRTNHNTRDCREAVLLARYLARHWQEAQCVLWYVSRRYYAIYPQTETDALRRRVGCQLGYTISPDGTVQAQPHFPAATALLGEA